MTEEFDEPMFELDPTDYPSLPDNAVFVAEVVSGVWMANVFRLPATGECITMLWDECDLFEPSDPERFTEAELRAMLEENESDAIDAEGIYAHITRQTREWLERILAVIECDRYRA